MFRLNSIVATISQSGFLYRDSKFIKTALKICLTKQLHQNSAISAHQLIARLDSKRSLFPCYQPTRGKKSRGKRAAAAADESDNDSDAEHDSDSDHEDNDATGEDGLAADYKDKTVDVNSMRFNVVAKAIFGGTRNKVDSMYLEDRYRLDNERIGKKSVEITEGQQLDLIAGKQRTDDKMIIVHRATILEVADKLDNKGRVHFKFRRFKPMVIENYEDYPYDGTLTSTDDF